MSYLKGQEMKIISTFQQKFSLPRDKVNMELNLILFEQSFSQQIACC